jgi:hypothetical protein
MQISCSDFLILGLVLVVLAATGVLLFMAKFILKRRLLILSAFIRSKYEFIFVVLRKKKLELEKKKELEKVLKEFLRRRRNRHANRNRN